MYEDGLSEPERRLWMEFPTGGHVDLSSGDPQRDDPATPWTGGRSGPFVRKQ